MAFSDERIVGLLAVLDLTDPGARTREDIFTASSQWMPHDRVYGGQVLAQSVLAASRTAASDRLIHSLHGYFLRPGAIDLPITLAVDRIHDGRSFATRRVQAHQNGLPIFSMIASFQVPEAGVAHQTAMPADLPGPDDLPDIDERIRTSVRIDAPRDEETWASRWPFEFRHIPSPIYRSVEGERSATQAVWMRTVGPLPDDEVLHRAVFAFASDQNLMEPVMRRHGVAWTTPGLRMASLDHAMWWHRPGRADEWFLYAEESPNATGGRGLGFGRIYRRDGTLIASTAQEGMIRVPAER